LWIESNIIHVHGNVFTQGDVTIIGNNTAQQSNVKIDGSFVAQNGVQNITIVGCLMSVGNNTSLGGFNAPLTTITIGALTETSINASISAQSVILRMDSVDKGHSNFGFPYTIVRSTSPINFPVTFEQDWTCGNYKVNATISTTSSISVTWNGQPLLMSQPEYCCFESCPSSGCSDWICDTAGFIIGWVIGGIVAGAVLIVSCTLFARDFMAVVKQK